MITVKGLIKLNKKSNLVCSYSNTISCFLFPVVNHWLDDITIIIDLVCDPIHDELNRLSSVMIRVARQPSLANKS